VPERYGDFGPTLAAEHLAEDDGLHLGAENDAVLDWEVTT
jgi:hypothetical protein